MRGQGCWPGSAAQACGAWHGRAGGGCGGIRVAEEGSGPARLWAEVSGRGELGEQRSLAPPCTPAPRTPSPAALADPQHPAPHGRPPPCTPC